MNFFDEELKEAQISTNDALPDEICWADIVPKRKPLIHYFLCAAIILTLANIVFAAYALSTSFFGKGWILSALGVQNSGSGITVDLQLSDKPTLDDSYYQADGRYTAEGVAAALSPSVVSILSYEESGAGIGQGSGFFISSDGFIVTNAHVVSSCKENGVKVRLYDGTYYQAQIVGIDERTDLAVIKITGTDFSPVELGDSSQLVLGEEIIAIGSPAGLNGTVTKGIVSGLEREIKVTDSVFVSDCIQIDAAINPGNSGGVLVNMWGQVVGVVSAKLASENYDGIGFAISTSVAKPVIESLIENGCVSGRVKIGITFYEIDEESGAQLGITPGLLIDSVEEDCDISKSGIEAGDIITHIEGQRVYSGADVSEILEKHDAGDELSFTYEHDEQSYESSFKLMDDSTNIQVAE